MAEKGICDKGWQRHAKKYNIPFGHAIGSMISQLYLPCFLSEGKYSRVRRVPGRQADHNTDDYT